MSKLDDLIKRKGAIKLDIGGGWNPQDPTWVNIDYGDFKEVDIKWDLEKFPWPLPDECASVALARHVVEHINPLHGTFIKFMDEAWRVLKPGASFAILTPMAGSDRYFQDPTHVNPCNQATFLYFDPLETVTNGHLYHVYEPKPWNLVEWKWQEQGDLQVLLTKRRDDKSYHTHA